MSLLRTKSVQVGTCLAFTGVHPEQGQTFIYGPPEFFLERGDVVKVIDIDRAREADTPWAKVTVAVLKGKLVGRIGVVGIDLSARLQRSWQALTHTGSMEPVRAPSKSQKTLKYSLVVDSCLDDGAPTAPAPRVGMRHASKGRCA